tara:strand:+ start:279 stop:452 length:174 start_codon:yes stop_codon:yes gene_type:complete
MKRLFIIIILITGCSKNNNELKNNYLNIEFSDDISFEEFKIKLEDYGNNSPIPNLNN